MRANQFIGTAINVLSSVAGDVGDIERRAASAGIDVSRINWQGSAKIVWYRVLQEAGKIPDSLEILLADVYNDYPTDQIAYIRSMLLVGRDDT